jgi:cell volume regulation protein A
MLAGSEGLGGIEFSNAALAQSIGTIALIFILFSGGLDTDWKEVRPVVKQAFTLATLGVLITAVVLGILVSLILDVSFLWGLLIGSIVSSTDAAAVFSIIRTRKKGLKDNLKPLLELESGSNDPMAIFLTIGTIELLLNPGKDITDILLLFVYQMGIGSVGGFFLGKLMVISLNRMKFTSEGIYPVFAIAMCVLIFSVTASFGGSGFLAIYIAGLVLGNSSFIYKKGTIRFFDGLAVLSQIAMFLTLGLLVFPSQLVEVALTGLLISAALIFVGRPLSVYISLAFFKFNWREKIFISWVGLRGAVPIILATFPLIAGVQNAELIFNIVFFIVLTSVLLQGWSLVPAAVLLKVAKPLEEKKRYPIEFNPVEGADTELVDFIVPYNSKVAGKALVDLFFPADSRIVLIWRNEQSIVPSGGTVLEPGDTLLILVNKGNLDEIKRIVST